MIRVLQLVKTSVGATWALRQMRELVKLGVDVHVALPPGPLVEKYQSAGATTHLLQTDFPSRRLWQLPSRLRQLRHLVEHVTPDLIHSHFVGTTLTMRLALGNQCSIPRIFQVPGPLHLENGLFRQLDLSTAGPYDYWIGSCQWTCNKYRTSGIDDDRIYLSYYGTDIDGFSYHRSGKLRSELGLGPEIKIVGMVAFMYAPKLYLGQTRGLKGHEDLIDAIAICRKTDPSIVGVFIGGAWNNAHRYEQRVHAYAKKYGNEGIIFLGTRGDVPQLYPDFNVAVHPSHSENVGGAVESLLMGIPTIATKVGGFPDVVIPDETGWLVPPGQPKLLASAINEVLENPSEAARRAARGQGLVKSLFDIKETSHQVFEIYKTILQRS